MLQGGVGLPQGSAALRHGSNIPPLPHSEPLRYSARPASRAGLQPSLMRTAVFSIISPNYRHAARVLMASAQRHHPEWDRFVLLVGGAATSGSESFTTVQLEDLPLPNPRPFCFRYSILD